MPPKATVTTEDITRAAFNIVDKGGLQCLTARGVAMEMGISTRPVYFYFSSMEELQKEIMNRAIDLMLEYTSAEYTDWSFLNMGAGFVRFAREHKQFFHIIFLEGNKFRYLVERLLLSLGQQMKKDPLFRDMSQGIRDDLLKKMWILTHGLAAVICSGLIDQDSDKYIIQMLKQLSSAIVVDALKKSRNKKMRKKEND